MHEVEMKNNLNKIKRTSKMACKNDYVPHKLASLPHQQYGLHLERREGERERERRGKIQRNREYIECFV